MTCPKLFQKWDEGLGYIPRCMLVEIKICVCVCVYVCRSLSVILVGTEPLFLHWHKRVASFPLRNIESKLMSILCGKMHNLFNIPGPLALSPYRCGILSLEVRYLVLISQVCSFILSSSSNLKTSLKARLVSLRLFDAFCNTIPSSRLLPNCSPSCISQWPSFCTIAPCSW